MKILIKWSIVISMVIVTSGCAADATPSVEPTKAIPIKLELMKKDRVEQTYVSVGEVVPDNQVDIFVNGAGYIETIEVATGDKVEKDQVLIYLDDAELDRTSYNATESQLRTVRDNIGNQLASLRDNFARQQGLFDEGIITVVELNQLQVQIDNLAREYSNAKTAYRNQLKVLDNNLDDAADARIIKSTVSGTVASVVAQEGQGVSNQVALTIIDDSHLFVKTFVSSDLKKLLSLEDLVNVSLDGKETLKEKGSIAEIGGLPDRASKLFEVLIKIDEPEGYIIGDYTEIEFIIKQYEATMVPTQAVLRSGDTKYIYIYENEELKRKLIETGRAKGEWLEVKNWDKLSEVVVLGQSRLTPDSEVVIGQ